MDLAPITMTMTKEEAMAKVREYRSSLKTEDRLLARGYRALAKGQRLVELSQVIRAGGQHPDGLPRLAALRADASVCFANVYESGSVQFRDERGTWIGNRTRHFLTIRGVFAQREKTIDSGDSGRAAMVPPIPPRHRPTRGDLSDYLVVWEAEWVKVPQPPGDPALLRQIGGDLYVVLATWDLTALERAVLAGTRRS